MQLYKERQRQYSSRRMVTYSFLPALWKSFQPSRPRSAHWQKDKNTAAKTLRAPPPAPLKGPAATRPKQGPPEVKTIHASSRTYKTGPPRKSKHLHQPSVILNAVQGPLWTHQKDLSGPQWWWKYWDLLQKKALPPCTITIDCMTITQLQDLHSKSYLKVHKY